MYFLSYCKDLEPVIRIAKSFIDLLRFGVPILLIIMGTIDLAKAVISSKEDEMKKAQSTLIKRLIYAVAVFLVVTLVTVVMNQVVKAGVGNGEDWRKCWDEY